MAAVARCYRAPRGLLLPRAGECHRRRGAGAGAPLLAAGSQAALALCARACTVLCQPPARGPPFSHRGALGVELGEGARRAASEKQLAKITVCGRNGRFSAFLFFRKLGFVARRAAWDWLRLPV